MLSPHGWTSQQHHLVVLRHDLRDFTPLLVKLRLILPLVSEANDNVADNGEIRIGLIRLTRGGDRGGSDRRDTTDGHRPQRRPTPGHGQKAEV